MKLPTGPEVTRKIETVGVVLGGGQGILDTFATPVCLLAPRPVVI